TDRHRNVPSRRIPTSVRGRTADVTLRDARSGGYAKIEATGSTHEPEACCFRARDRICTSDRSLSRLLYRSDRILTTTLDGCDGITARLFHAGDRILPRALSCGNGILIDRRRCRLRDFTPRGIPIFTDRNALRRTCRTLSRSGGAG